MLSLFASLFIFLLFSSLPFAGRYCVFVNLFSFIVILVHCCYSSLFRSLLRGHNPVYLSSLFSLLFFCSFVLLSFLFISNYVRLLFYLLIVVIVLFSSRYSACVIHPFRLLLYFLFIVIDFLVFHVRYCVANPFLSLIVFFSSLFVIVCHLSCSFIILFFVFCYCCLFFSPFVNFVSSTLLFFLLFISLVIVVAISSFCYCVLLFLFVIVVFLPSSLLFSPLFMLFPPRSFVYVLIEIYLYLFDIFLYIPLFDSFFLSLFIYILFSLSSVNRFFSRSPFTCYSSFLRYTVPSFLFVIIIYSLLSFIRRFRFPNSGVEVTGRKGMQVI